MELEKEKDLPLDPDVPRFPVDLEARNRRTSGASTAAAEATEASQDATQNQMKGLGQSRQSKMRRLSSRISIKATGQRWF